jgi:hypothetical protein
MTAAPPVPQLHHVVSDTGCNAPSPRYVGPVSGRLVMIRRY